MSRALIQRLFKHLSVPPSAVQRYFSADAMRRIEAAIATNETMHAGEIRFVVEAHLHVLDIFKKKSSKQRAIEVFSQLRIWDTEQNNGVLIYLLLADYHFEIVADRGLHQQVGNAEWERISNEMAASFKQGRFEAGVLHGISKIGQKLAQHYPSNNNEINELPNAPIVM